MARGAARRVGAAAARAGGRQQCTVEPRRWQKAARGRRASRQAENSGIQEAGAVAGGRQECPAGRQLPAGRPNGRSQAAGRHEAEHAGVLAVPGAFRAAGGAVLQARWCARVAFRARGARRRQAPARAAA